MELDIIRRLRNLWFLYLEIVKLLLVVRFLVVFACSETLSRFALRRMKRHQAVCIRIGDCVASTGECSILLGASVYLFSLVALGAWRWAHLNSRGVR